VCFRQHTGTAEADLWLVRTSACSRGYGAAMLRIGGRTVDRDAAFSYARRYLTEGRGWSYPSYDGYQTAGARGPLTDADLLAPILLNVRQFRITAYEALQGVRPRLTEALDAIPRELKLAEASDDDLTLLGDLFAPLSEPRIPGVRGTILSKVLHRKRPEFVFLFDPQVASTYQVGPDAPLPEDPNRSWREFAPLLGAEIRKDLQREQDFWRAITELAPGPAITELRALDIVAWWAGGPDGPALTGAPSRGMSVAGALPDPSHLVAVSEDDDSRSSS
jgi:hypothetical protein